MPFLYELWVAKRNVRLACQLMSLITLRNSVNLRMPSTSTQRHVKRRKTPIFFTANPDLLAAVFHLSSVRPEFPPEGTARCGFELPLK